MGVRVMSFNARKDTSQPDGTDGRDGSDAWPHRRELLLEDIFAQNPDILGTQELMPHMAAWLREQLEPAEPAREDSLSQKKQEHIAVTHTLLHALCREKLLLHIVPTMVEVGGEEDSGGSEEEVTRRGDGTAG